MNMVKDHDSKKPSSGFGSVTTNVMYVARWDILLEKKYVQLGVKRVLNAK